MDEYISNPTVHKLNLSIRCTMYIYFIICLSQFRLQKFTSHAVVKPIKNKIRIKTERGIEQQLCLKKERKKDISNQNSSANHLQAKKIDSNNWSKEKQHLVEQIVSLKAENHQNLLAMKNAQAECVELLRAKQKLEQNIVKTDDKCAKQINELKSQISVSQNAFSAKKINDEKLIEDLAREKKVLLARIKQFQTGLQQKQIEDEKKKDENIEYEVEAILNHREMRQYLVRWKGYDSDGDTWENESNLNCRKKLKQYHRSIESNRT